MESRQEGPASERTMDRRAGEWAGRREGERVRLASEQTGWLWGETDWLSWGTDELRGVAESEAEQTCSLWGEQTG